MQIRCARLELPEGLTSVQCICTIQSKIWQAQVSIVNLIVYDELLQLHVASNTGFVPKVHPSSQITDYTTFYFD
jgi:hypothetical protein